MSSKITFHQLKKLTINMKNKYRWEDSINIQILTLSFDDVGKCFSDLINYSLEKGKFRIRGKQ